MEPAPPLAEPSTCREPLALRRFPGWSFRCAVTTLRSMAAGADQQFQAARGHGGGQWPDGERAAGTQRKRVTEPGAGRQGGEQVLERGEPGLLPDPTGHERGG